MTPKQRIRNHLHSLAVEHSIELGNEIEFHVDALYECATTDARAAKKVEEGPKVPEIDLPHWLSVTWEDGTFRIRHRMLLNDEPRSVTLFSVNDDDAEIFDALRVLLQMRDHGQESAQLAARQSPAEPVEQAGRTWTYAEARIGMQRGEIWLQDYRYPGDQEIHTFESRITKGRQELKTDARNWVEDPYPHDGFNWRPCAAYRARGRE